MHFVATTIDLNDFKNAFLGTNNFVDMPCWKYITHLVVKDFLNIAVADNEVCVAGSADRFGWVIYKSLLRQITEKYPNITVLLEFHELVGRDLLYGAKKFPCCKIGEFIADNFPKGKVGLSIRVVNYMSAINLEAGIGASINCLRATYGYPLWMDIENKNFRLSNEQASYFDGVFAYRGRISGPQKTKTIIKIERPFVDARVAYNDYAGMMTRPLFQDGSDATMLEFYNVEFAKLRDPSMFNTCLKEWNLAAQQNPHTPCSKCALPKSVCEAQLSAPGSCSKQTGRTATLLNAENEEVAGMIFLLDE